MFAAKVEKLDPQEIFWKKSDAEVPQWFAERLAAEFGKDDLGDPRIRVRLDATKFSEPIWIVEEKWGPEIFGSIEEWNATRRATDEHGTVDFGDFPRRGIYASIMLWADHEGRPMPLGEELITRLHRQRRAREEKSISPEQVMMDEMEREMLAERQQEERKQQAIKELADEINSNADKIIAGATRDYSFLRPEANRILPIN